MFNKKKKVNTGFLKEEFDELLLSQINQARLEYHQAQESETALVDSRVNGHMIQAQTAVDKAKFLYLYNEAKRRKAVAKQPLIFKQPQE
ncbi:MULTISPECIES: YaaL family protein [Fructobacillus]|jgi:hypothetical protein|uniref:DUF2508 family protein n=2 Tax=Fructobacillus TaxID=559173 RepID=A0A3F3HGC7_9LACO|nr:MULTISPECIES: YaaL family protein [Fructobacillus]KMK53598.1 hypothetical protein FEFB_06320 [Fructobacillus sp. EFB-N1]MCK8627633.1 YaaL family protein [Fructobacillus cardui]NLS38466.1 DUF2508 family protein [Fructobacillus tropaeoli]CAK1221763.1 hypothetical protein R53653_IHELHDKM_00082 [Fructobacillus cardui]CAK1229094.1 hypothetical protein LMG30237_ALEAABJJ_00273 [Fructobacillus tropaeoli]